MTTIAKKDLIFYRAYQPEDRNFILTTWLRGLWEDNDFFHRIKKRTFCEFYEIIIKRILENSKTFTSIACLTDSPDVILGYAVISQEDDAIHWLYVKHLWRRIGIARDLLKPFKIKYATHYTAMTDGFKPKRIQYNPFL